MKAIIFISVCILLVGIIKTTVAKTEIQKYEVIYKKGNFEIRFYPEAIMASYTSNGNYDNSRNSSFRVLAAYIFGGNKSEQKIAMTAPVRMSKEKSESTMSFVLPSEMTFDNLPVPENEKIVLHRSKPVYVATLKYSGYTSDAEISKKRKELIEVLAEIGISYKDEFEYLGYNPPYQIVNRRNEILVELNDFNQLEWSKKLANID